MALRKFSITAKLPFLEIEGVWEPNEAERKAAWEMYVELVTRISVVELGPTEGILREALSSLYSLFGTTRDILRRYGPTVAKPSDGGSLSFGFIAVAVLNGVLRPVLATWHPRLQAYENTRPGHQSISEYEQAWPQAAELRIVLETTRHALLAYASLLGEVAGAPSLLDAVKGAEAWMRHDG
jgi:hypothetical protein